MGVYNQNSSYQAKKGVSQGGWNPPPPGLLVRKKCLDLLGLTTTDIFLFNVGKANTINEVNYEVLEKIKDGRILASKYDSKELKFKTPNIVVVFSNDKPDVKQLASDRWKIFSIINEGLVEDLIPKGKKSTSDSNGYERKIPTCLLSGRRV